MVNSIMHLISGSIYLISCINCQNLIILYKHMFLYELLHFYPNMHYIILLVFCTTGASNLSSHIYILEYALLASSQKHLSAQPLHIAKLHCAKSMLQFKHGAEHCFTIFYFTSYSKCQIYQSKSCILFFSNAQKFNCKFSSSTLYIKMYNTKYLHFIKLFFFIDCMSDCRKGFMVILLCVILNIAQPK